MKKEYLKAIENFEKAISIYKKSGVDGDEIEFIKNSIAYCVGEQG